MAKKERIDQEVADSDVEKKNSTPNEADSDTEDSSVEVSMGAVAEAETGEVEPPEETSEEEKLKARVEELEDKLLRSAAEFDNYKKRMARQFDEILRFANDKILLEVLEVVDNFERALRHNNANTNLETFSKGTELIFNQITGLLGKYDVTPIEALGQPFDPNLHEALMQVESDEYPEGVVAIEMNKGYMLGNRVLRHSKVGVSKGKTEGEK